MHWRQEDAGPGTGWELCPRQRRELERFSHQWQPAEWRQQLWEDLVGREQRGREDSLDGEDEEGGVHRLAGWQCPWGGEGRGCAAPCKISTRIIPSCCHLGGCSLGLTRICLGRRSLPAMGGGALTFLCAPLRPW